MLSPKRTKFRKQQRGRMRGVATTHSVRRQTAPNGLTSGLMRRPKKLAGS